MFHMFSRKSEQCLLKNGRENIEVIPYAPWCWNIYKHLPHKSPSYVDYVDKYTSTMEHLGMEKPWAQDPCEMFGTWQTWGIWLTKGWRSKSWDLVAIELPGGLENAGWKTAANWKPHHCIAMAFM